MSMRLIGVDTGGTFTDLVALTAGTLEHHKLASTPADPARAVLEGVGVLTGGAGPDPDDRVAHGTTVGTNAVLTGQVAAAVLVTTRGFEDVLEIGRQDRPRLYDLEVERPRPLIAAGRRLGIAERIGPEGQVEQSLAAGDRALAGLLEALEALDPPPEAIAVSLLHAYANPNHERLIGAELARRFPGIPLTLSSELIPVFREYERTSTVVVNAAVQPVMSRYLGRLREGLGSQRLTITTSSGGSVSARRAAEEPVRTLLSGPAAGVAGALAVARRAGFEKVLTFDMGGTSTDVALCDGAIRLTAEGGLEGYPLLVDQVDLHTVGAGGGSLARVDRGGALVVGPQSAGADPGPLAYGRRTAGEAGEGVTVTDANLLLGRLPAAGLLGGGMALDDGAARSGLERLAAAAGRVPGARPMTPEECAEGVVRVAVTTMAGALRRISVERGKDPRGYVLVSFGGAGAMHAAALAREMGIDTVLIPREPGLLSAVGTLVAGMRIDRARTVLGLDPGTDAGAEQLECAWRELEDEAVTGLDESGAEQSGRRIERWADLRYRGQSFELTVEASTPATSGRQPQRAPGDLWTALRERFAAAHRERYGYDRLETPVELVSIRVAGHGPPAAGLDTLLPPLAQESEEGGAASPGAATGGRAAAAAGERAPAQDAYPRRDMIWEGQMYPTPQIPRSALTAGTSLRGPALMYEFSATTIVPPGARVEIDPWGDLILKV